MPARTIVLSSLGPELEVFDLDTASGALTRLQSVRFPAVVQAAWPNRARTLLIVAASDAGPMAKVKGSNHLVQPFRILPSGTLEAAGPALRLRHRPIHLTLDRDERHLLVAYNDPSGVTVHPLGADGAIGEEIPQPQLDFGPTAHQVRVAPNGTIVVVPACAHHPEGALAGSIGVFSFTDGRLGPLARIEADPARAAPWRGVRNGANGLAARHVDFHPSRPWMYLCLERQGEIWLFDYDETGISQRPRAIASTLESAAQGRSAQAASAIHVHPSGRFVYVTNRAWDTERVGDRDVFVGGANGIAAFAIDAASGAPVLIQQVDSEGIFPRTFGIDAAGETLVVGNQEPMWVQDGDTVRRVVPSLVIYRIGKDGRLTRLARHDYPDDGEVCFWVGVITTGT